MTFEQLIRIVLARKKLAASVFLTILLLTLLISLILPKSYLATATVVADIKPDPVSGLSQMGMTTQSSYLTTQADIIQSPNVALRVTRMLRLAETPAMKEKWQRETEGKGDFEAWLGELIGRGLKVKPSRDSNVLEINYKGADPVFSTVLANTYAKAYIDSVVQMKVDPARKYVEFFEDRARAARTKLENAQARLTEAQREKGILASDERMDVETARLTELAGQLVLSKAMIAETSSRNTAAQKQGDNLQDVIANPMISTLKAELSRQYGRLNELQSRYGDAHPVIIEAKANIKEIESRIRGETARVQSSVGVTNNIAHSREAAVQAAFEEQRNKLLTMKEQRAQLAVLEQEVNNAQRVYDAIQTRLSQVNLESNSAQSNIYLLSAATEPSEHASPRLALNMIIAFFPATLLAVLGCIGAEMRDRRVRGANDLRLIPEVPVIGFMPHPLSKKKALKQINESPFARSFALSGGGAKASKGLLS